MPAISSIIVAQHYNPKFDQHKAEDRVDNPLHKYEVLKTVNTIEVAIGGYLTPVQVQGLIDRGVNVTTQPVK